MKTRLVLWGRDADDARVLVIIALKARENKVDIWTFPEQVATESLYNRLMNEWRMGQDIPFPNTFVQIERPLSVSEPILPEDIKVDRTDLVQRARTEWHFVVLSAKLHDTYKEELQYLREKIEDLDKFDNVVWEEMKGFWEKVSDQIKEKNLFRDHARKLKDEVNELFANLKDLRKAFDEEFRETSRERLSHFMERLEDIEERIEKGLGLKPLFEELKDLQRKFRDTRMTRDHHNKVWKRLDKAFKDVKAKRFGPGARKDRSTLERLKRRHEGLMGVINRMERSIARDKKEANIQDQKIEDSSGQLEAQIREARHKALIERIDSKEQKLREIHKTRKEVEQRMAVEEERQKKREEAEAQNEIQDRAKDSLKERAAKEVKETGQARKQGEDRPRNEAGAMTEKSSAGQMNVEEEDPANNGNKADDTQSDQPDDVETLADEVGDKIEESASDEQE